MYFVFQDPTAMQMHEDHVMSECNKNEFLRGDHGLLPGTHIASLNERGAFHHGILVGADHAVHFEGTSPANAHVREDPIAKAFGNATKIFVIVHKRPRDMDGAMVVAAARSRIGATGAYPSRQFDIISNNCEHFATWCATGKIRSVQVCNAIRDPPTLGVLIALAGHRFSERTVFALRTIHAMGLTAFDKVQ
jgi:hypothetical protein